VLRRVGNIVVYLGREAEASAALTTLVREQSWLPLSPRRCRRQIRLNILVCLQIFGHAATLVQSGQSVQSTPRLRFNAEDEPRASLSLYSTYGLATFSYS
jgi:hypothetical protein